MSRDDLSMRPLHRPSAGERSSVPLEVVWELQTWQLWIDTFATGGQQSFANYDVVTLVRRFDF